MQSNNSRMAALRAQRPAPPPPPAPRPPVAPQRPQPPRAPAPRAVSQAPALRPVAPAPIRQQAPRQTVELVETISISQTRQQEQPTTNLVELRPLEHAAEQLNPIADLERKAMELLSTGASEPLVAVQCGVSLSRVFELRRGQSSTTMVNRTAIGNGNQQLATVSANNDALPSPKEVFSRRMRDFDECLEIAIAEYKNDPESESNYNAMNGFMKTMESLYKSYEDLDDPQEVAERIVKQIVYPFMSGVVKINLAAFRSMIEDMSPTLVSEFQREQFREGLKDATRKIEENVRSEYNRAIKTLEVVYQANLATLFLRPQGSTAAAALDETEPAKREAA